MVELRDITRQPTRNPRFFTGSGAASRKAPHDYIHKVTRPYHWCEEAEFAFSIAGKEKGKQKKK